MNDFIDQVQSWAEFIGPNIYLQAAAIAVAFIFVGKITELVLSRAIAQIVSRSQTEFDDGLVALLQRPIFVTFVLIGLAMATRRLGMSGSAEYITLGILRTIAIVVWYGLLSGVLDLVLITIRRRKMAGMLQASMLPLISTILNVLLIVLAIYFLFLAWDINVTAWVASAGIVGLALSFAAKDTLSNLFAGVSLAADAPYKTGDFIILDSGDRGMVTHIGLRSTRFLTRDDVEITVPNGVIGNAKIINEAGGPSARHRIRTAVGVAYGSDIDQVIETLAAITTMYAKCLNRVYAFEYSVIRAWTLNCFAGSISRSTGAAYHMNSIVRCTRHSSAQASKFRIRNVTCTSAACRHSTNRRGVDLL